MNHALITNILIILLVALIALVLKEPLAILALMLLRELPYGLVAPPDDNDEEGSESGPMGFV